MAKKLKIINAVSASMIEDGGSLRISPISIEEAREEVKRCVMCYGTKEPSSSWATKEDQGIWGGTGPCGDMHNFCEVESAIGHQSTAELFSSILDKPIPVNRISIKLEHGEIALLGSVGSRLPEGKILSKEEIAKVDTKWYLVQAIGKSDKCSKIDTLLAYETYLKYGR